ncbi:MAG: glycosyltransferase family 9 protein, partial [Gillisia sp.]
PRKPFRAPMNYLKSFWSVKKGKYDLVINVVEGSSSGRLLTQLANSKYKVFGTSETFHFSNFPDFSHIAKKPVYTLRNYLSLLESAKGQVPVAHLDLKLTSDEIEKGKNTLQEITRNSKKSLCIFTFATGEKCLSKTWWKEFYSLLKSDFPNYNIIEILPVENVSQIDFEAPSFYSKDVREIAAFIANTEVFIGADSGIMHLASSSKTPTVGLFSVSDADMYMPYNTKSIALNTEKNPVEKCSQIVAEILNS